MQDLLTIGEVARRSGVAASALRFYEDRGLIRSERAGSGHRRYPRAVLRRVAFIVFAQRIGLSLEEIGVEVARLPGNHVPVRADWARLSGSWTARIDQRIAELERLRDVAHPLHRMRLPLAERLPDGQPRRSRQPARRRSPLLAGDRAGAALIQRRPHLRGTVRALGRTRAGNSFPQSP